MSLGRGLHRSVSCKRCSNRLPLLRKYEAEGRFFERLALLEECKSLPWNAVWDYFCLTNDVPVGEDYIADIEAYEKNVTSKRQ